MTKYNVSFVFYTYFCNMKKFFPLQMWSFFLILFFISCETDLDKPLNFKVNYIEHEIEENIDSTKLVDRRDNQTYEVVKIGNQFWMAENLNFESANGSRCYDNEDFNCRRYGRLYTWDAIQNVCPRGWHLPTREEWNTMIEYLGGSVNVIRKIKATTLWRPIDNFVTNESGFSALPGGYGSSPFNFSRLTNAAYWWTSTALNNNKAWYIAITNWSNSILDQTEDKTYLMSCRCVKD